MTDFSIDDVMGFNPADLSAFNEPEQRSYDVNVYKTNPKDSKSESGHYHSRIRLIYNPFDPKDSIVHQATYYIKDTNGGLLVRSRLGNGPSDPQFKECPLFKAWKKLWFSGDEAEKQRARDLFDKVESDWVLVQILEDENKPELVGQFKTMKLPASIKNKLAARMNPSKESKKTPYPVMDYVIGLELNMEVVPGPDDPSAPERKQREISYDICDFGDYAPIINVDGTPFFTDEELELIDSYVTAIKDSTGAKTEAKRKAAVKQIEDLRPQIKPLYQKAYEYVKANAVDLRKEAGWSEWDEKTQTRIDNWIKVVLAGKNPEVTSVEDLENKTAVAPAPAVEAPAEPSFEGAPADDLPF